ncbi:MAG: asparagine synthase [Thaumarchaeota archaeon]|nr:asparagine synthase [Nitrososphaerota archaeon]
MQEYVQEKIEQQNIKKIVIALSGGIDSTLVLSLLRKKFPDIDVETISIKFAESFDESEKAAKISEFFGVKHSTIVLENYLKELPQAIHAVGLPFWDLHWYYVVKKAKTVTKHLASGDGGDELFGGYTFRYSKFLSLITKSSTPLDKVKAYLACHERDSVQDQEDVFGIKAEFSWDKIYSHLLPYFDNSLDPLDQVFLADYNGKLLYNFSIVNTKIHQHFEINNIAPILSKGLIDYSTRLSANQKYDRTSNLGKIPLRQLLKKFGTDHFISAEKYGFSVNTLSLWKSFGKHACHNYLSNSQAAKAGLLNDYWITKYLEQNDLDVRYVNKFLGLLAVEIWHRLFVTKDLKPTDTL